MSPLGLAAQGGLSRLQEISSDDRDRQGWRTRLQLPAMSLSHWEHGSSVCRRDSPTPTRSVLAPRGTAHLRCEA